MSDSADVVVVGGGLVGAACAYELARDGHDVTLVDRHDVGRATDAGAGILSPETLGGTAPSFVDLADLAGEHYRELVGVLAELGAPDPRYDVCGALRVAFREGDDESFAANAKASLTRHPNVLERVTVDEARSMFPPLGPIRDALFNTRGARVDGRSLVVALEFAARALGVDWRAGVAGQLVVGRGHVRAVETPTATINCGAVVIAGGAWTTELASSFGMRTGVRPVRGQIVHLHLDADTGSWPVLQPIQSHYVVPFRDGRLALGATVEDVGFDARPTASGLRQLFSEGLRLSPGLADATFLEVRVGLRPVSDDDLPIIGALPGAENAYVASGHGANGLLLGPVTGRVVADVVNGRAPSIDLTSFSPARFE
ncbi:MAG: FAD-dependent oxidoreductase [Acidimicrobiia bacterium]